MSGTLWKQTLLQIFFDQNLPWNCQQLQELLWEYFLGVKTRFCQNFWTDHAAILFHGKSDMWEQRSEMMETNRLILIFISNMVEVSRIAKKMELDQCWLKTNSQIQFCTIYVGPRNIPPLKLYAPTFNRQ